VGSNAEIKAMLQFSAEHGIKPVIEPYSMADVNPVLARQRSNRVRCRAVLAQRA
jgi:uncharacterized zinc-type alcohol dehydrogenase-like protein